MTLNILQQHPTFHDIFAGYTPADRRKNVIPALPHDVPTDTTQFNHEDVLLAYSPLTGDTYRLGFSPRNPSYEHAKWRKITRGTRGGYTYISINGATPYLHRIIARHFPISGEYTPNAQIDHINHVRDDNRLANLRWVTPAQNQHNCPRPSTNTSGFKGVVWHKRAKKWLAQICLDGKNKHLGLFPSPESAYIAYCAASRELHGEHGYYDKAQLRRAIAAECARMECTP